MSTVGTFRANPCAPACATRQCRFTAVATPERCPWLDVSLHTEPVEGGYTVTARMADDTTTYLGFKGEMHEQA